MAGIALPKAEFAGTGATEQPLKLRRFLRLTGHYSLSALGPVAVSGAHFVASLVFLRNFAPADFGLFSFLLVVVPFCMSASGALLGAPLIMSIGKPQAVAQAEFETYRKVNLAFSIFAGIAVAALLALSGAARLPSLLLGFYGAVMTLRWFARSYVYVKAQRVRAVASDLIYSGLLVAGLCALMYAHALNVPRVAAMLLGASVLSLLAFGWRYLREQFRLKAAGSLAAYRVTWHELSRWSLLGVVLTEMTANAHAYFVTFISGPQAFALLALGGLLMRPVSLVLSALPDMERPIMARRLAEGDAAGAWRSVNEFRTATAAVWLATIALAAGLLLWFPHLLLKKGYDGDQVLVVVALWAVIAAVRALRTPDAVFLMAAGQYEPLARVGMKSSVTSLAVTLLLLLWLGPIASLGGILAGDLIITVLIFSLTRAWRRAHG